MKTNRTITSIINSELREFSKYVCYNRAIPNCIDGFKPVQRKAFYLMGKKSGLIKVQSLSGNLISEANYNHGDMAASEAISAMGQFFPGANNIPPFLTKGSFGNKFIKDPSAARYIYVKKNNKYYDLFKDFEILEQNKDIENPEPNFYYPIIPTILLNGISGIAVGFATSINSYFIKDIISNCLNVLEEKPLFEMTPFYEGYAGKIIKEDDKYVQYGVWEQVNTTVLRITDLPISYDREKYHNHLYGLIEKNLIYSFKDENKSDSDNQPWNITIKLPRNSKVWKDPIKWLGLTYNLNENLTTIDENGTIKVFDNVNEIIKHFVDFRLTIYEKRIKYQLERIKNDAILCKDKINFIIEMSKIDFKSMNKQQLKDHFSNTDISSENLKKCFEIRSYNFNNEFLTELKNKINLLKEEYRYYKYTTAKTLYIKELREI